MNSSENFARQEGGDHRRFCNCGDDAGFHRGCGRDADRMTIHAAFAKKLARLQNLYDRFLALLGHDGQLDLSRLNVKHGVRAVALRKHGLILLKLNNSLPHVHPGEEVFGIKHVSR
jgi:hypothetical protein